MRVLLVSPSPLNAGEWTIPDFDMREKCSLPISIGILREVIKHTHQVHMLFYDHSINDIPQILREADKSDVVGFSVNHLYLYPAAREIVRILKEEETEATIILGGVFSTRHARFVCKDGADIVIRGEGEVVLPQVLDALENGKDLSRIKGVMYKEGRNVINTGLAPFTDLESLPPVCYDALPLKEVKYTVITCETSRGCPKGCSFCAIYSKGRWRGCSPEKSLEVMEHAQKYVKYSQAPFVFLGDSNFAANINRVKEIAELVDDEIPSYTPMRLDDVNEDTIKYFQKIGFKAMCIGIESASETILASINKQIDAKSIGKKLQLLIDHGIAPRTSFIVGLPSEDRNSVISTARFIRQLTNMYGKNLHLLVFPCRRDVVAKAAEFEMCKSIETVADSVISSHDQEFRQWALAMVYLMNVYHETLDPEDQVLMFDTLIEASSRAVVEMARKYDGEMPPQFCGLQRYFESDGNR